MTTEVATVVTPSPSAKVTQQAPDPEQYRKYLAALASGRKATAAKKWEAAISAFGDALAAKPGDLRALAERGYARLLSGEPQAALLDFDLALDGPADAKLRAQIHFNGGLAHLKLNDKTRARQAFAASLAHQPTAAAKAKLAALTDAASKGCFLDVDREARTAVVVADYRAAHVLLRRSSKSTEEDAKQALGFAPDQTVTIVEQDYEKAAIVRRPTGDLMVIPKVATLLGNGFKCPMFPEIAGTIENGFLQLTITEELCETVAAEGGLVNWSSQSNGSKRVDHVWDLASAQHVVSVVRTNLDTLDFDDDEVTVGSLDKCFEKFPRPKL